jgi:hypothetical protein
MIFLTMGLYVVEARDRNPDGTLGPWEFVAAFVYLDGAELYLPRHPCHAARIGYPDDPEPYFIEHREP